MMKRMLPAYIRSTITAVIFAAGGLGSVQASITGFDVNFDGSATTYTNDFKRWVSTPDDPQGFTWGAGVGTGGTGGLTVDNTAGNNIFYRPSAGNGSAGDDATSTFNISGLAVNTTFNTSLDFQWANTTSTGLTVITMGFTPGRTLQAALTSTGSLAGSIIRNGSSTVTLRLVNDGTAVANTFAFNQSLLTAGNWYRLSYDLTKTGTSNVFAYTVSLYSIGATGTSTATLVTGASITGTVTNTSIYADPDAFFGYDIRDTATNTGITRVDNFIVASGAIPEPSTYALMAGGAMLLVCAVRRRTVRSNA